MVNIDNKIHKKLRFDQINMANIPRWVVPFMVGSWFIGFIALFWVYAYTEISFLGTLKYLALFSICFTLIPYKWMVKIIPVDYYFMLFINLISFGPLFTSVFLLLNFFIVTQPVSHISSIVSVKYGTDFYASSTVIQLADNELREIPKFRTFDSAYRIV
ncbi:MAG: hypothetical protein ACJAWO_002223, partial [Halieaceae bacterium]